MQTVFRKHFNKSVDFGKNPKIRKRKATLIPDSRVPALTFKIIK